MDEKCFAKKDSKITILKRLFSEIVLFKSCWNIYNWVSLFLKKKKKESNTFQEEETVRVRDLELGLRMEF